ncbi:hypothetical protein [Hymenobacter psychrophilus]|uniref:SpoIIAA-like n=1 Tax=Hymenobacter psychrophilus TaxID=651662 RepID=A0A1H3B8A3_9BACT|nr:hypothetical protein [Hymenobacter psychrophilus]SDX38240.1 hypothetical protein SAMN04488069_101196 [Hymenobacter psychrophilus]
MILRFHDIQAQYAPAQALLRFQFRRPSRTLADFQRSMRAVAQLADQQVVTEGLIDLHELPEMQMNQQLWTAAQWLPRVSGPAVRHVAFVIPSDGLYNQMVIETLHRAGRHFIRYEVQFFSKPAVALDWLLSFSDPAAQPGLEQEWAAARATPTPTFLAATRSVR